MDIQLTQHPGIPLRSQIDTTRNWIMVFAKGISTTFHQIAYGRLLSARMDTCKNHVGSPSVYNLDLPNKKCSHVSFCMLDAKSSSFQLLCSARALSAPHRHFDPQSIGIVVHGFSATENEHIAEIILSGVLAAFAHLPNYTKQQPLQPALHQVKLYGVVARDRLRDSIAIADGNTLARALGMLPGNVLTPGSYLEYIQMLATARGWRLNFLNQDTLQKKRAGAFLAVAQGSPVMDAGIVHLQYRPQHNSARRPIALVGKGICYDTGGVNLKPANYMYGMHADMMGSATALGTLYALDAMEYPYPIDCWLALASNHIGSRAYKPNDIVVAANGTRIEIVHTDAEGRMVLADTLALASATKPRLIIDYATLTGSCIHALGKSYSGFFTNRPDWIDTLVKNGTCCGERIWPFPLDDDYDKALRSDTADIKQCTLSGEADHILAARFLQRFVAHKTPWIHIDLSSSENSSGLAHIPTKITGFGIRYSAYLLQSELVKTDIK